MRIIILALLTVLLGIVGYELCFNDSGFGGYLPFAAILLSPVLGWLVRGN